MKTDRMLASFGRVMRVQRERLGYSQESFADRVALHRTYIGSVERGERNVSLRNLLRIADALGKPLSNLLAQAEKDSIKRGQS